MASPFPSIATAAKTVVDALAGAPTTRIKKRDVVQTQDDPDLASGLLLISYGGETGEEFATMGNGTTDQGDVGKNYALLFSYYKQNIGGDLVSSQTTNPNLIDSIKEALNKGSLSGVGAVWNTQLEAHDEWENEPFREGVEVSRFVLHFQTVELRNG